MLKTITTTTTIKIVKRKEKEMLIHTSYSCYYKSNRPIRKGFTAKDRYNRALEDEKKNTENAGYKRPKKALPKTITRYVR